MFEILPLTPELLTELGDELGGCDFTDPSQTDFLAKATPCDVQAAPGNGKTKTGRLWVYVRDDRASADMTPPAVWFAYTPDRKGIHPQQHLEAFSGTLQADAYGGYQAIYGTGRVSEAACWAHARRQFYE